jgi:hypothetical protein
LKDEYLFIDVLQRPVGVLAIAHSMAPHTCLTGILFSFDQHFYSLFFSLMSARIEKWVAPDDR